MAQEIELKLAVPEHAIAPLLAWLDRHGARTGEALLRNIYLDTPDREIAGQRAALRLRSKGGAWLQTLKTAGRSEAGLAVRQEWETDVAGEAIEPERLPAQAQAWLAPLRGRLTPVFRTDFMRRTWRLHVVPSTGEIVAGDRAGKRDHATDPDGSACIEAAFDIGAVEATGPDGAPRTEPIQELELEWISGDASLAGGALTTLGRTLCETLGLTPSDLSKAARGYRLAGDTGKAG